MIDVPVIILQWRLKMTIAGCIIIIDDVCFSKSYS